MPTAKAKKLNRAYGPKRRVRVVNHEPSQTKQSFTQECDINQIMAKFQKTGAIDHLAKHQDQYGFANSQSFHEAMNIVSTAKSMFQELPSSIRRKFENDPAKFLDFVEDPDNHDELVTLGLANAPIPEVGVTSKEPSDGDSAPTPPPAEPE